MQSLCALVPLFLISSAAVATAAPAGSTDLEVLESALVADDACHAGSPDSDSSCALNEVQLHAEKAVEAANFSGPIYDASCYGSAGSSTCGKGAGKCVCERGCMGADGDCYASRNKVVASNFVLKNVKWPDQKIYVQRVSVFGQLKTTSFSSSFNFGQDKFTLYELPGKFEGKRMFFLASQKWPSYVVSIRATKGTAISIWGTYAVSLAKSHESWALKDVMMQVCSLRLQGHPNAVKFGTSVPVGGSSIWAYIKSGSYFLYGYWYPERVVIQKVEQHLSASQEIPNPEPETPGPGGFWVPDPPIPHGVLPDC